MVDHWKERLTENAELTASHERKLRATELQNAHNEEMRPQLFSKVVGIMRTDATEATTILNGNGVRTVRAITPKIIPKIISKRELRPKNHPPLTKGTFFQGVVSRLSGNYDVHEFDIDVSDPHEISKRVIDVPEEARDAWPVLQNGFHWTSSNEAIDSNSSGGLMIEHWIGLATDGSLHYYEGHPKTGRWSYRYPVTDKQLLPDDVPVIGGIELPLEEQPAVVSWREALAEAASFRFFHYE